MEGNFGKLLFLEHLFSDAAVCCDKRNYRTYLLVSLNVFAFCNIWHLVDMWSVISWKSLKLHRIELQIHELKIVFDSFLRLFLFVIIVSESE